MASSEFSWHDPSNPSVIPRIKGSRLKLSDEILIGNIRWFIVIRWGVIGALVLLKICAILIPDTLMQFDVIEHQNWPIAIVLVLSAANFAYLYALNYCKPSKFNSPSINLWVQIIIDLLCLSVVVHYVGSTATPASFFYVLHIALACIFFSTLESLMVTILVCIMYTIVLLLESTLIIPVSGSSILVDPDFALKDSKHQNNILLWMFALDILFIIVWYVVSRLALVVRTHEHHLLDAYNQINQAQEEKDRYAVLMTHQLKSPLDAIRSKINLINAGYCGESSEETKKTLVKIDRRAKSMSGLILDLLRLQRLKETCLDTAALKSIDIKQTLQNCIDKLIPVANAKHITLNVSLENFIYRGIPDQLEILLENIIANAITYSHDNTCVEITTQIDWANSSASLIITDHGIGIEHKDLPNIFNEYFYSPRAALHNKASSGIGLSIVKIAAENNKLQIKVTSEPGLGTSFTVIFKGIQPPTDNTEDSTEKL
ncbi:MAG: HAMP domain-containing histidine kinase [Nitrosomonas sp.]|nr:HAMP domain-containing histidine kinase [Nitrosomonas sp.]